jgi:hypothetical protein
MILLLLLLRLLLQVQGLVGFPGSGTLAGCE